MKYTHTKYSQLEIEQLKLMELTQKETGFNMINPKKETKIVKKSAIVGTKEFLQNKKTQTKQSSQNQNLFKIISKMTLFNYMQEKEIKALIKNPKHQKLKLGKEIITYGTQTDRLYFIIDGTVKKSDFDNIDLKDKFYTKGQYINVDLFLSNLTSSCEYTISSAFCELFSFELNEEYIKRAPSMYIKFYKNLAFSIVDL